ncbi:MAG: hypothetical protein NC340_09970 [Ruminococcus flavefaciens]|nr:hypothetical protein [Ruminococcus flavefaciens]MCM1229800.1 hypothetical protein [Ruminococcus flavefaciens]
MKHREFIYTGDTPDIDGEQYRRFISMYQKAVIASLEKRNLLTRTQGQRCREIIEGQFNSGRGDRR